MAYDEGLADRIRKSLGLDALLSERKMFGGLCFMVNGNMAFGIVGEDLMVRVGPERYDEALSRPFAREMDFNGRPMRGFVYVEPEGSRWPSGWPWRSRGARRRRPSWLRPGAPAARRPLRRRRGC